MKVVINIPTNSVWGSFISVSSLVMLYRLIIVILTQMRDIFLICIVMAKAMDILKYTSIYHFCFL